MMTPAGAFLPFLSALRLQPTVGKGQGRTNMETKGRTMKMQMLVLVH